MSRESGDKVALAVRLPKPLMEALRALAVANRRGFGMQVEIVLEEGMKALGVPVAELVQVEKARRAGGGRG